MAYLRYAVFPVPSAWAAVLASDRGIRALNMQASPQEALDHLGPEVQRAEEDLEGLMPVRQALESYFGGDPHALEGLELDLEDATPFFQAAWQACRSIPPGETRSYGWLAKAVGRPRAFRAAGQAMARNRIALAIPCHRVIGSDGGLHGYGMGGLTTKARLLEMERQAKASNT